MAHLLDEYVRVSQNFPCPRCGKTSWCLIHESGRKCLCTRIESGKRYKDAGWLHYVGGDKPVVPKQTEHVYLTTQQVQEYLRSITSRRNNSMIERQAQGMGLSHKSLDMMHATYDQDKAVLVFPMFGGSWSLPIGCRFRRVDGKKWSLKGGREGVFLSRNFNLRKTVWIAEGPTDAAALVTLGFTNVIGRPNCSGGETIIRCLLVPNKSTPVIIVSDPDPPGLNGATTLARLLPNPTIVIAGPSDIRDFVEKWLIADARAAIMEGLGGDELTTWRPVFFNNAGRFHNFTDSLQK